MGFLAMVGSGILGLVLLILGCLRVKNDRRWLVAIVVGLLCVAVAVWLGWPK